MKYPRDLQQAKAYLLHFSPYLSERDITYPKEQGGNHFTMFVKDNRVIRIPRDPSDVERYSTREVEILNYLDGKTSFDIPKVLDYDPDKGILCLSKVYGDAISYNTVNSFGKRGQKNTGEALGRFLAEMAMVKIPKERLKSWSYWDEENSLLERFQGAVNTINFENIEDKAKTKIEASVEYISTKVSEGMPRYLSHFDFNLEHILFKGQVPTGLIDFDSARADILPRELLLYSNGRDAFSTETVNVARKTFSNMTGIDLDQRFWPHANRVVRENLRQKMLLNR